MNYLVTINHSYIIFTVYFLHILLISVFHAELKNNYIIFKLASFIIWYFLNIHYCLYMYSFCRAAYDTRDQIVWKEIMNYNIHHLTAVWCYQRTFNGGGYFDDVSDDLSQESYNEELMRVLSLKEIKSREVSKTTVGLSVAKVHFKRTFNVTRMAIFLVEHHTVW